MSGLGFQYQKTNGYVRFDWKDGKWSGGEFVTKDTIEIPISASGLHYGQSAFEGLKAYTCKDKEVRIFRFEENAKRMQLASERLMMPTVPAEMFQKAVHWAIRENREFVPDYESKAGLYIRPLLFGSERQLGLNPAQEYCFLVFVTPVGNYYEGDVQAISAIVLPDYDRAAPNGVGHIKASGNYAAGMEAHYRAVELGYPIALYMDAKTNSYVEEFGTSNFIAVTQDDIFVTPKSNSILASITNDSLQKIAADLGYKVEQRPVPFDEVKEFKEVGACGTAVGIIPINKIKRENEEISIPSGSAFGPMFSKLHETLRAIQYGECIDNHQWCTLAK